MCPENVNQLNPELEKLLCDLLGSNWRHLREPDIHGAWGIACVWAVLKGCNTNPGAISKYLGVDRLVIQRAFYALSQAGALQHYRIESDRKMLEDRDSLTWLYYAGYASEATGNA